MSEPTKNAALSETEVADMINANITKILAKQEVPQGKARWTKKDHISLILRTAMDCGLDKTQAQEFGQFLATAGLGGNQSQFTQSKFLKDKIARETLQSKLEAYDVE